MNSKWLRKVNKQTPAAAAAPTSGAWDVNKQTDHSHVSLKNAC